MSRSMNRVTLIGRLGNDAEIRYMKNGHAVANFSIATSETWKDKQTGDSKEITDWHRVVVFGKLAEALGQYLVKGHQVYVEGALKTRQWQNEGGQTCYMTEVVVSMNGTVMLLGNLPKPNAPAKAPENHQAQPVYQQPAQIPQQQPVTHQANVPVSNLTQGEQNAVFRPAQNQPHDLPQNSPVQSAYENAYGQSIDYDDDIPF